MANASRKMSSLTSVLNMANRCLETCRLGSLTAMGADGVCLNCNIVYALRTLLSRTLYYGMCIYLLNVHNVISNFIWKLIIKIYIFL